MSTVVYNEVKPMDTVLTSSSLWTSFKNTSYFIVFVYATAFLGFEPRALAALLSLMLIDTITGIVRSFVLHGGTSITSSLGTRGLLAKLLVISGLLSLGIASIGMGFDTNVIKPMMSSIVIVFTLAELYSILGNIHSAVTRQPKSEYDAMGFLMRVVRDLLMKYTTQSSDKLLTK